MAYNGQYGGGPGPQRPPPQRSYTPGPGGHPRQYSAPPPPQQQYNQYQDGGYNDYGYDNYGNGYDQGYGGQYDDPGYGRGGPPIRNYPPQDYYDQGPNAPGAAPGRGGPQMPPPGGRGGPMRGPPGPGPGRGGPYPPRGGAYGPGPGGPPGPPGPGGRGYPPPSRDGRLGPSERPMNSQPNGELIRCTLSPPLTVREKRAYADMLVAGRPLMGDSGSSNVGNSGFNGPFPTFPGAQRRTDYEEERYIVSQIEGMDISGQRPGPRSPEGPPPQHGPMRPPPSGFGGSGPGPMGPSRGPSQAYRSPSDYPDQRRGPPPGPGYGPPAAAGLQDEGFAPPSRSVTMPMRDQMDMRAGDPVHRDSAPYNGPVGRGMPPRPSTSQGMRQPPPRIYPPNNGPPPHSNHEQGPGPEPGYQGHGRPPSVDDFYDYYGDNVNNEYPARNPTSAASELPNFDSLASQKSRNSLDHHMQAGGATPQEQAQRGPGRYPEISRAKSQPNLRNSQTAVFEMAGDIPPLPAQNPAARPSGQGPPSSQQQPGPQEHGPEQSDPNHPSSQPSDYHQHGTQSPGPQQPDYQQPGPQQAGPPPSDFQQGGPEYDQYSGPQGPAPQPDPPNGPQLHRAPTAQFGSSHSQPWHQGLPNGPQLHRSATTQFDHQLSGAQYYGPQQGPPNGPLLQRSATSQFGPGPGQGLPQGPAPYRPGLQRAATQAGPHLDVLPSHPPPVRPGHMPGSVVNLGDRPPPVRNYGGAPGYGNAAPSQSPEGQDQASAAQQQPPIGQPRKKKEAEPPVTAEELEQLRAIVKNDPNDQTSALRLAKKLVEAADVLVPNLPDPKARARSRERYLVDAHKILKKLEKANNPEAMFFLADCLGRAVFGNEPDPAHAFTLYQSAAKLGHAAAAYRTAVCCEIGNDEGGGTRKDPLKAMQWYKRAAALGDTPAMYKVGMILLKGLLGQQRNPREAISWLKRAAERADEENPHALHELALLYESAEPNDVIIRDEAYAFQLFKQAAELGYKFSQFRLGCAYEYGLLGCPIDPRLSIMWYSRAAMQEEHQSELALSGWYLTGSEGVLQQSDTEAYLWARKAAMAGLAKAEYAMGYFTEVGIGVPPNLEDAKRWYWRAAAQDFPKARERLEELKRAGKNGGQRPRERISRSRMTKQQDGDCVVM
ncbi:putative chitin synthase regulatory factor [Thermochaetoides thermophila DSM 1495]|uniref:Putative chitin synthase regulatory factor n=1 Tax=Chaetomium thermophilum (strain DSM 1495 / CBS 144.50 / IMI 039719) TaxID=759272 RepID=G0S1Q2_CHATD|nr:putative chitin synthase regulatory factor [Thermochaetoides thermophila DSM 1495]EGS22962.1 putative chitin synthase regulatory factor [Thermochaetoides thermophila DSM 1495]